ncbi:MAG: DUF465 domain-containing protein [Sphingomonadaceae bacterium]
MTALSYRLLLVHRRLESEIRAARLMRWPDAYRIQRLKKLRLAIKDRLHALALGTLRMPHTA